jgi:hypothetical protein
MALFGLFVLLAVPRIARIAYLQVWIEDESYLNSAFLLARGFFPYRDFPLPHFPTLEGFLASIFLVAPISIRTVECVTQVAAFLGSGFVFAVGRRLGGTATGVSAAVIFATSALLFRYHLFEREVFVVVPVLGAALIAARPVTGAAATRAALAAGLLMFTALTIKLTAIAAVVALALQLRFEGRRRSAAIVICTALGLLIAATIALAIVFGTGFIVQVFVFRAVHAAFPSLAVKLEEVRYTMDISLALGIAGTALLLWTRQTLHWIGPLLQLVCGGVVLVLLNPTYWAHTGIELLPWLSLAGGYLVAMAWAHVFRRIRAPGRATAPGGSGPVGVCLAGAAALLLFVIPIHNLNWRAGDEDCVYGFGYRDRAELERVGQFVRAHAAADAPVATPPIVAFIANRGEVVPYQELAGEIDELTEIVRRDGYLAAVTSDTLRHRSFWDSVEASRDRTRPTLDAALERHQTPVLINDSPADLMPVLLTDVSQAQLEAAGYRLEMVTAHYEAWLAPVAAHR